MSSDKLIYVWYKEYGGGFVQNQGITLIKEYIIEADILAEKMEKTVVKLKMKKNPKYFCPSDFYGKNICGLTAVVGENGSGKTTFARMLMDSAIPGLIEKSHFFWLTVNGADDIIVYSYMVEVEFENRVQCIQHKIENNYISAVYMTNMFNFAELVTDTGLNELNVSGILKKQIYSPANLLRNSRDNARKRRYGYFNIENNLFLKEIIKYADYMEKSEIDAYVKKQEELNIFCYKKSSKEVRKELGIFQSYEIRARGIREYIVENVNRDEDRKLIKRYVEWCEDVLKEKKNDLWINIYMLCVSEVCFALYGWGESFIEEIKRIGVKLECKAIEYLEILIKDIEMPWKSQMVGCLNELKKQCTGIKKDWTLGVHKFEETEDLIDWYYEELKKSASFFKRNLYFTLQPSSTGELAMSNLFSYIVDAMIENPRQRNFLLIIDEIDAGIHPRWQQRIILYLLRWLETFEEYYFQIIITSHSPIVLSDILKEHVVKLKKNQQNTFEVEETTKATFGANIAMQFLDSFYMDDGNIGEFSKSKIKTIIKAIKNYETFEEEQLLYLIDSIGEEMVRKKLHQDMRKKRPMVEEFVEQWLKYDDKQKEKILQILKELNVEK